MDLLQLLYQVPRLLDQLRLRHLGQLMVQSLVERVQLLYLILHALPLRLESQELVLEFGVQLVLNVLHEVVDLFQFVVLCLGHFVYRVLHVLHVLMQLFESLLQHKRFLFDHLTVLVVNVLDPHELVVLVLVSAEHVAF